MNREWLEKDFYKELGISSSANPDEVKKAYRKLARDLHPDKNPGDSAAEERFKAVSEAHAVLSDPDKRKEYDEARKLFAGGGFGRGGFTPARSTGRAAASPATSISGTSSAAGPPVPPPTVASATSWVACSTGAAPAPRRVRGAVRTWRPRRPSASARPPRA